MGQTRSNSSTGGTARTTTRPADVPPFLRKLPFPLAIVDQYAAPRAVLPTETLCFGGNRRDIGRKRQRAPLTILPKRSPFSQRDYQTSLDWGTVCSRSRALRRKVLGRSTDTNRKAIVRTNRIHAPLDERHTLDLEAGYIRPLHFPQLFRNSELVRFFGKQEIENLGR